MGAAPTVLRGVLGVRWRCPRAVAAICMDVRSTVPSVVGMLKRKGALAGYNRLTDPRTQHRLHWFMTAKRPATSQRSIDAIVQEVTAWGLLHTPSARCTEQGDMSRHPVASRGLPFLAHKGNPQSGFNRYVRNPMYVGLITVIVGQALLFGQCSVLLYAAVAWVVTASFVCWYEEPTLLRQFGAEYETYRRAVPAWWPRLRPWSPRP
jgi:hypothetical protein